MRHSNEPTGEDILRGTGWFFTLRSVKSHLFNTGYPRCGNPHLDFNKHTACIDTKIGTAHKCKSCLNHEKRL